MPVADTFDDAMANTVRYYGWPHGHREYPHAKPSQEETDLAVSRGYLRRWVENFPGRASALYVKPSADGENMLHHYPDGQRTTA